MKKWQGFYSTNQVSRLAGIPKRTLYQWKRNGIIAPSIRVIDSKGNVEEGYSYADLAIIKLLRALRIRQLNLRSVVVALHHIYDRFGVPNGEGWADAHVYVVGKNVFAQKPDDWDTTEATRHGQKAEMNVLGKLVEEEAALLVPKSFSDYIEINPDVMDGEPVIKDTRVPTFILATMSDEGMSLADLANLYSPISAIAIEKAIDFEKALYNPHSKDTKVRASVN